MLAFTALVTNLLYLALEFVEPAEKGFPLEVRLVFSGWLKFVKPGSVAPPASLNICSLGAFNGYFFITVICSSVTSLLVLIKEPSPCSLTNLVVVVNKLFVATPILNLFISIFLGSELLSVQNNKPSTTLTPVIK